MYVALVLLGILLVLAIWVTAIFNSLVRLRNRFKNAFSQIDVQLQRRYDLIPNLVETAKAYLKHERETLEAVIQARNMAATAAKSAGQNPENASLMKGLVGAEATLTGALSKFFATVEAYPDLKANQNMSELTEELSSTENRIAFARQAFNDAVMTYNTAREVFPNIAVANFFNFSEAELFEVESYDHRQTPKVSFG
ncbi:MAG: hypothetical protein COV44_07795 [Deltaproteobacteria bacterium CG11_big_fil_rev_8_21_14_0_20_45_16]|nr:MAG: hypothetical protein COV44_07795 [Deltaproteobacteria bacterium CG11_big_fil_rev_8_21_14_0_20_45_16]